MWFSTHCNVLAACKDARQMAPFTKYNALGRSELSTATSSFEVKRHGFKPRKKQLVTLTDKALNRLREICNDPTRIVKLMFVLKGCNGYSYEMEIVDRNSLDEMDEIIKDDAGNSVLAIENKTAFHMLGCHIDYAISPLEEGFVFDNPNVTSKCGCGQSFRF
ncbi:hypothetical protein protein [Babesia ovis]|uniref:Core domain-containing protein n=1 Tax=Babesia ovis TaxID=5869 RepID=A0A9W5T8V4_BABOV|nr:hypothetical protein protein [Babesia ovis]